MNELHTWNFFRVYYVIFEFFFEKRIFSKKIIFLNEGITYMEFFRVYYIIFEFHIGLFIKNTL